MKESLDKLIKLQSVDSQLMEIEELKGDLPAQLDRLTRALEVLEKAIVVQQTRLEQIEHEKRQLQATIDDKRVHLKRYQDQLLVVSTNRAYDALMAEIDSAKKTVENSEFQLLELDEEHVRLTDELKAHELEVEEKRSVMVVHEEDLRITISETEVQAKALEKERRKLERKIKSRYYRSYERIRAARDGQAVVLLSRNSCGACYNRIPPQRLVEIKAMDRIITCDSCGVILHWEGSSP